MMKFCKQCGGEVERISDNKYSCTSCGRGEYVNPKASVGVFLRDSSGLYAFAVRGREPEKGKLECIGGFLDIGEGFEQALYRELEEEAGLTSSDIEPPEYVGSVYDDYLWQGAKEPVASAYFVANIKSGAELKAADDVAEIVFLKLDEVDVYQISFEGMKQMYSKLLERNA